MECAQRALIAVSPPHNHQNKRCMFDKLSMRHFLLSRWPWCRTGRSCCWRRRAWKLSEISKDRSCQWLSLVRSGRTCGFAVSLCLRADLLRCCAAGPYRSGKSFLLNQLLGVSCGGFQPGLRTRAQTTLIAVCHFKPAACERPLTLGFSDINLSVQTMALRLVTPAIRRQRVSGCGVSRFLWRSTG